MEVPLLQQFRVEWLDLPLDQLGARLLTEWACYQAARMGIAPHEITPDILQKIRATTLDMDTNDPRFFGLEKPLKRACSGDAAEAGRLFREHMMGEARSRVDRKLADDAISRRRQVRNWSKDGQSARRKYSDEQKARWRKMAASLRQMSMESAAEHIRKQEHLPKSALRTIRRVISKNQ